MEGEKEEEEDGNDEDEAEEGRERDGCSVHGRIEAVCEVGGVLLEKIAFFFFLVRVKPSCKYRPPIYIYTPM